MGHRCYHAGMLIDIIDIELAFALRLADMYEELARRLAAGARVNSTFRGSLEQIAHDARLELAEAEACGLVRVTPSMLLVELVDRKVH